MGENKGQEVTLLVAKENTDEAVPLKVKIRESAPEDKD